MSLKIILGTVGLGLGAHIFVLGAKGIALALGVSSLIVGMSIVALGTSLPEMATSIAAAKQNQSGFVIGNIIGSNIMNIVAVLGFTLLIKPISIDSTDMMTQGLFMIILTIGLFIILNNDGNDTDTFGDACDNCPQADNEDQVDTDEDGAGDMAQHEQLLAGGGGEHEGSPKKGFVCL